MYTDTKENGSIVHISISDMVAEKIRDGISDGTFKENEKLNETDLCKKMEVSRTPIRKAFDLLIEEGVLKRIKGFGVVVAGKDIEMSNYIDMLISLERIAMEKAIENIKQNELKELILLQYQLEELLIGIRKTSEGNSSVLSEIYELDIKFHQLIMTACGNPLIGQYIETICKTAGVIEFLDYQTLDKILEHREIIKALEERNTEIGDILIKKHFDSKC